MRAFLEPFGQSSFWFFYLGPFRVYAAVIVEPTTSGCPQGALIKRDISSTLCNSPLGMALLLGISECYSANQLHWPRINVTDMQSRKMSWGWDVPIPSDAAWIQHTNGYVQHPRPLLWLLYSTTTVKSFYLPPFLQLMDSSPSLPSPSLPSFQLLSPWAKALPVRIEGLSHLFPIAIMVLKPKADLYVTRFPTEPSLLFTRASVTRLLLLLYYSKYSNNFSSSFSLSY